MAISINGSVGLVLIDKTKALRHSLSLIRDLTCKLISDKLIRLVSKSPETNLQATHQHHCIIIYNKKSRKSSQNSPKKVNLVAALVRGMLVEHALMQLQVIDAALANASHNHGLDPDRLIIGICFKKRISIHGKGKCGLMIRPECCLTS
ncbi:unnamed protein product [Eruca vesicaria subsp. sativa]|uniref:Ribosomal protein L22 n=1 Tax=Eruca vesicaria subsp. sativa TaxID=29727 RepID=A0ABC8MAI4_ERUVS|nr:unnamed protein product [Eruca vesicaria subsp. sativa]